MFGRVDNLQRDEQKLEAGGGADIKFEGSESRAEGGNIPTEGGTFKEGEQENGDIKG